VIGRLGVSKRMRAGAGSERGLRVQGAMGRRVNHYIFH